MTALWSDSSVFLSDFPKESLKAICKIHSEPNKRPCFIMTVGTKRESFVQMDIGHWYQSSTASNRIWHVIYCWIYLWNLVEAEVFVLQKEKTQQVPNKLSWYVKHLPKFGNHSHFWRRCMKSVICLERELSCWIRFVNLKGADVIHFRWFRTQKNSDYTKHGSSANRKHHADSHIYMWSYYML